MPRRRAADRRCASSMSRFTYPGRQRRRAGGCRLRRAGRARRWRWSGRRAPGKTTIANLLLRFWDPEQGAIRLDGVDLRELTLDGLRGRIALVAQDTYLFNDTLEANVRLARPDATREEIAARAAARRRWRSSSPICPRVCATRVGERGVQLSGGQRQRIAIARAFLKDAPILVLDEATSHLDTISEQLVRSALDALMADRTTIVVAHRLSTIQAADRDPGAERRPGDRGRHARRTLRAARLLCTAGRAPAGGSTGTRRHGCIAPRVELPRCPAVPQRRENRGHHGSTAMDAPSRDHDYERCPECGAPVDMTDSRQVARHMKAGHEAVVPAVPGGDRGGLIEDNDHAEELGNFATCAACGQTYERASAPKSFTTRSPGTSLCCRSFEEGECSTSLRIKLVRASFILDGTRVATDPPRRTPAAPRARRTARSSRCPAARARASS